VRKRTLIMTREQSSETPPRADADKKSWIEPELDVFPMSETESTHPLNTVQDSPTNLS
jgi:hypothetical protein